MDSWTPYIVYRMRHRNRKTLDTVAAQVLVLVHAMCVVPCSHRCT